jgi:hypothetical protein
MSKESKLYLNKKFIQNTGCEYCKTSVKFITDTFELPEKFKNLIPQKPFDMKTYMLIKVDVLESGEEVISGYARTPNEVRSFLKEFNIINLPPDDYRMKTDLSLHYANLIG